MSKGKKRDHGMSQFPGQPQYGQPQYGQQQFPGQQPYGQSPQQQFGQSSQQQQQQQQQQQPLGQSSQPATEAVVSQGRQLAQESTQYINALKLTGQTQLALQMEQLSSTIWSLVTTADSLQHQLDQKAYWQGQEASQQSQQPQFAGSSL